MTVYTSYMGTNDILFEHVFSLHLKDGWKILDMTYGTGVFWKRIDVSKYTLIRNDLDESRGDIHKDFRNMPYPNRSFDAVILDPPYAGHSSNKNGFAHSLYNNSKRKSETSADTLQLYYDGMMEAERLLKPGGLLFVKCMDEIESGKQRRNHISIYHHAVDKLSMIDEDMFVLVQSGTPVMRHTYQLHARKNNSFLWVFRKMQRWNS